METQPAPFSRRDREEEVAQGGRMASGHCLFFLAQMNDNICKENTTNKLLMLLLILTLIYLNLFTPAASPPSKFDRSW